MVEFQAVWIIAIPKTLHCYRHKPTSISRTVRTLTKEAFADWKRASLQVAKSDANIVKVLLKQWRASARTGMHKQARAGRNHHNGSDGSTYVYAQR